MRRDDFATFCFNLFDCLLFLVIDDSLFLEVFDLWVPSALRKYAIEAAHVYPAVCAVLLKHLVRLSAGTCSIRSALLGIDTVENVVPVQAFEEGVSGLVALLPCRLGRRYECAVRCLLGSRIVGRG